MGFLFKQDWGRFFSPGYYYLQDTEDYDLERIKMKNTIKQKLPTIGVLRKRYIENMQHIYRRTPISKCDFNKVALQLY